MTTTTVFTNNRSQAIRLPAEMRLPEGVKRVDVRVRGCERIIGGARVRSILLTPWSLN
jgi:antitoxin VapB